MIIRILLFIALATIASASAHANPPECPSENFCLKALEEIRYGFPNKRFPAPHLTT